MIVNESALALATDVNQIKCAMPARIAAAHAKLTLFELHPSNYLTGDRQNATAIPVHSADVGDEEFFPKAGGFFGSGSRDQGMLMYDYYPQILSVYPNRAQAIRGATLNVTGAGFIPTERLKLRFSRRGGPGATLLMVESAEAEFVSEEFILVAAPVWPSDWGGGKVNVSLLWDDRQVPGWVAFEYDETVSELIDTAGRASGDFVSISGYGFVRGQSIYYCTISSTSNASRAVRGLLFAADHSRAITCDYPAWPFARELVTVQVWKVGHHMDRLVGPEMSFHGAGLEFNLRQVWMGKSLTRHVSYNGGTQVTVDGFGLVPNPSSLKIPNYECRFTEDRGSTGAQEIFTRYSTSTGGVGISPSTVACSTPVWLAKSRLGQLTLHACRIAEDAVPVVTESGDTVPVGSFLDGAAQGFEYPTDTLDDPKVLGETPEDLAQFKRNNMLGVVGLVCDQLVEHIGPWYGAIAFDGDPPCMPVTAYPCTMGSSDYIIRYFGGPTIYTNGTTPNAPIRGGPTITLAGRNFGYKDVTPRARVGDSACEFTRWISETCLQCGVAAMGRYHGPFARLDFVVTVAVFRANSRSAAFSYDGPDVHEVGHLCVDGVNGSASCGMGEGGVLQVGSSNIHSASAGSRLLYLSGRDLGVADVTAAVRVEGSSCERTMWVSSSWLTCRHAAGFPSTRTLTSVSIQYSQHLSTVTLAFSIDFPSLSGLKTANRYGTGSASVTVRGEDFGLVKLTQRARVGDSACRPGSEWTSETSMTCLVALGSMGSRRVVLTAIARTASISDTFSFDNAATSAVVRSNVPAWARSASPCSGAGSVRLAFQLVCERRRPRWRPVHGLQIPP